MTARHGRPALAVVSVIHAVECLTGAGAWGRDDALFACLGNVGIEPRA